MDGATFDRITKHLSFRWSRRGLALQAAGVVSGLVAGVVAVDQTKALPSNCRHFVLSGGKKPKKRFIVDDDMRITLVRRNGGRKVLLDDQDGQIGIGNGPIDPISFKARVRDQIRVEAWDTQSNCRSMKKLLLHCCENKKCKRVRDSKKLTNGYRERCVDPADWREVKFFDETFRI